jgi:hypothetical protein
MIPCNGILWKNTTLENIAPNVKQQFQNCQYSVDEIYFIPKVMLNILILYDVFHSRTRYYLVHELEDHILDAFPFHSHVSQPSNTCLLRTDVIQKTSKVKGIKCSAMYIFYKDKYFIFNMIHITVLIYCLNRISCSPRVGSNQRL